jgi:hypothetical protein
LGSIITVCQFGGVPREIDFTDTMKMRPYYDIDADVEKEPNTNYPVFSSINKLAIELIQDIFANEKKFASDE